MNYFPFHIGDYAAHTGHLEPMEDLAYMRLLQQYYLREGPLPADIQATAKLVRMRSMQSDVESVLNEFFELTEAGWVHSRCDAEIAKMKDKQEKARASGIASANARKAYAERKVNASSTNVKEKATDVERSLGEEPTDVQLPTPTPTPTPTPVLKKSAPIGFSPPDWINAQHWNAWHSCDKRKKATAAQRQMAVDKLDAWRQAGEDFAGALENAAVGGYQGLFLPDKKQHGAAGPIPESFRERDARIGRDRWEQMTGQTHPDNRSVIDVVDTETVLIGG